MSTPYRVVHVDDETATLEQVKEALESDDRLNPDGPGVEVASYQDFDEALRFLDVTDVDLVILDIIRGGAGIGDGKQDEVGLSVFERIQQTQFVPVIFYTGVGGKAEGALGSSSLVKVVSKGGGGLDQLSDTVLGVLEEGLPELNRSLRTEVREVVRSYMWGFVEDHWDRFSQLDTGDMAQLLIRRLSAELENRADAFAHALGGSPPAQNDSVHPMRYYVLPSIPGAASMAGDIMSGQLGDRDGYWIILTPSCDFARKDPETVLVAECSLVIDEPEFAGLSGEKPDLGAIKALINGGGKGRKKDRYRFLPGALDLPDLLVDLQSIHTIPWDEFENLSPKASLSAPFAEALLHQFARFVGRLGTPDLNVNLAVERLRLRAQEASGS